MKVLRAERGMSGWGLLFTLVVLGFAVLVGIKLFPVYMESMKIDRAMEAVIQQSNLAEQSRDEILVALVRRLDIDNVRRINGNNFKEFGAISKRGGKVTIEINYRDQVRLFGNLSLVADFEKAVSN